jgi:hypothetical protein
MGMRERDLTYSKVYLTLKKNICLLYSTGKHKQPNYELEKQAVLGLIKEIKFLVFFLFFK